MRRAADGHSTLGMFHIDHNSQTVAGLLHSLDDLKRQLTEVKQTKCDTFEDYEDLVRKAEALRERIIRKRGYLEKLNLAYRCLINDKGNPPSHYTSEVYITALPPFTEDL